MYSWLFLVSALTDIYKLTRCLNLSMLVDRERERERESTLVIMMKINEICIYNNTINFMAEELVALLSLGSHRHLQLNKMLESPYTGRQRERQGM